MDCNHARLLMVLQGRDAHELDADGRAALEVHLEQCADCLAWSSQEGRVDETLGRAIQNVPVPAALPSKILHTLEHQRRPRRGRWISAAAACLLVGLSVGGYVWYTERPELTFGTIDRDSGYIALTSAAAVEESFAEHGMMIVAPRQFNYDRYNWSGLVPVKGRHVPRIDFFHRGDNDAAAAVAHVYVIAEDRFDVRELLDAVQSPTPSNNHIIQVLRPIDAVGFVYIVVYTGGSLQPFLVPTDKST